MAAVTVATCSFEGSYELATSLQRHLDALDEAADRGAALIVFPEISLHGYPHIFDFSQKRMTDSLATAEPVPDGPSVRRIAEHAVARRIHVVYGMNELGERTGTMYNTAVLTGPDGHIGRYRKVHVHPIESATWLAGDDFPVFDTALGRIGIMICYDKWFPESARELMLRGADLICAPAAWGAGTDHPDTLINRTFRLYDEARALENAVWVVSSNYCGLLGDTPFPGMSAIVDPTGDIVATTGTQVGIATADIDIADGIATAHARLFGPRLARDRRPELYRAAQSPRSTGLTTT